MQVNLRRGLRQQRSPFFPGESKLFAFPGPKLLWCSLLPWRPANTYLTGKWHCRVVWRSVEQGEVGARRRGVLLCLLPKMKL